MRQTQSGVLPRRAALLGDGPAQRGGRRERSAAQLERPLLRHHHRNGMVIPPNQKLTIVPTDRAHEANTLKHRQCLLKLLIILVAVTNASSSTPVPF